MNTSAPSPSWFHICIILKYLFRKVANVPNSSIDLILRRPDAHHYPNFEFSFFLNFESLKTLPLQFCTNSFCSEWAGVPESTCAFKKLSFENWVFRVSGTYVVFWKLSFIWFLSDFYLIFIWFLSDFYLIFLSGAQTGFLGLVKLIFLLLLKHNINNYYWQHGQWRHSCAIPTRCCYFYVLAVHSRSKQLTEI